METRRLLPGEAADALRAAGIEIVKEHSGDRSEIRCRCRQHPDPDGHLYVNALTGAAFCHKCELSTNLALLCGRSLSAPTPAAALRQDILEATAGYYQRSLTDEVRRYLAEERALPKEIVDRFRVGWANGGLMRHLLDEKGFALDACLDSGVLKRHEDGRVRDFSYRRIIFPNIVGGRVVHLSGRVLGESVPKYLHLPGEIEYPYNADALRQPDCLWVEGILDVLSVEAWGHPAVAGLGTHCKETWLSDIPETNRVYVCLDGDRAGQEGTPQVAAMLGRRARIVTLPAGKDPNDLLREGRRDEFDTCLERAEDLVTFKINRVPAETAKVDLPHVLAGILMELASEDPASTEAHLRLMKARFGLKREDVNAYRCMIKSLRSASEVKAGQPGAVESGYSAVFDGLVDLVEHEGQPAFLVSEEGRLSILTAVERDGHLLSPPPKDQIPWLLPRSEEVLRWVQEDSDGELYDELIAYHRAASELPDEPHYEFIALWVLHTYVLEGMQYSPELCLFAVPERGKTRTGKAIVYVAYRGLHVESLRDAYIVRFAHNLGGTIFFDVMNLWRKAEQEKCEDIILGRYERGIKVPRVLHPDRGPHQDTVYFSIFGPTVIGTNEAVHHILDTRAVIFTMPEARRRFETDLMPETARPLRERLVAFRARHLGEVLPEVRKPTTGRLGDILRPLRQIVRLVRPDREEGFLAFAEDLRRQRLQEKAETLESELLRILDILRGEVQDGLLLVKLVTSTLNDGRPEKDRISDQRVGKRLRSLGFEKGQRSHEGTTIRWDEEKLARAMEAYGLKETTHSTHSADPPASPGQASVECAECAESRQGVEASRAHTLPHPDEVASWPPEWREAYDERFAIMTIEGEVLADEARRLAVECVKREFAP